MSYQKSTNVSWQDGKVSLQDRYKLIRQRGATLWMTGLSGSGKSTIAIALERALFEKGFLSYRLDGDNIRLGINKNLGFSAADRKENIRRIGEVSKLFTDAGIITLASFISPYQEDRDIVREIHEQSGLVFIEIFVDCKLESAEKRDPKGLYKKARSGELKNFTGIDSTYEIPENADLVLDTKTNNAEELADQIINFLESKKII